jgi:hypothetical protein
MVSLLEAAAPTATQERRGPRRAAILTHPGWRALLRDVEALNAPPADPGPAGPPPARVPAQV